jgi:hypothetical protein
MPRLAMRHWDEGSDAPCTCTAIVCGEVGGGLATGVLAEPTSAFGAAVADRVLMLCTEGTGGEPLALVAALGAAPGACGAGDALGGCNTFGGDGTLAGAAAPRLETLG